jgi:hypothetical protein
VALTFDEATHAYFVDGKQKPSITTILSDLGFNGSGAAYYTENSRSLGTAVDAVCAAVDTHCPQAETVEQAASIFADLDPAILPYLAGWLMFKREHSFTPDGWHHSLYSEKLNLCGTLDVVGNATASKGLSGSMEAASMRATIVDVKTWKNPGQKPKRSAEIQLAGYAEMWANGAGRSIQRWIVCLSGNGRYRLFKCENPGDFSVLQGASIVWHELHAMGVYKLKGEPERNAGD